MALKNSFKHELNIHERIDSSCRESKSFKWEGKIVTHINEELGKNVEF